MEGISRSFGVLLRVEAVSLKWGHQPARQVTFLEKVLLSVGGRCWQDPHESGLGDGSFEETQETTLDAE